MSKDNVVVGFVGLGTMGGRMAANVQRAGFKLVVHDLHRQAAWRGAENNDKGLGAVPKMP